MASGKNGVMRSFKGGATTVAILIVVIGFLGAWGKANNITSLESGYRYFKSVGAYVSGCMGGQPQWNCDYGLIFKPVDGVVRTGDPQIDIKIDPYYPSNPGGTTGGSNGGSDAPSGGTTSGEQQTSQGAPGGSGGNAGGPATNNAPASEYLNKLDSIPVADANNVAYKRSEWKHWIGAPCNTREEVLKRDGQNVVTDDQCRPTSGTWTDFYKKDNVITDAGKMDIDHVIPLGYAAAHGGQEWDAAKKQEFANDMSQLLAVSAAENRSKSDKGPEDYMPPNRDFRCTYSKIWVDTASKYGLSITAGDQKELRVNLQQCQ